MIGGYSARRELARSLQVSVSMSFIVMHHATQSLCRGSGVMLASTIIVYLMESSGYPAMHTDEVHFIYIYQIHHLSIHAGEFGRIHEEWYDVGNL